MLKEGFSKIWVLVLVVVIVTGGTFTYLQIQKSQKEPEQLIEDILKEIEPAGSVQEKPVQPTTQPTDSVQEELLFPCIALDIKIGDCTDEIGEKSAKTMKDYLANYTPVDLTDAEVVYCSEDEEDEYAHFWMFKTFYLDHWVGIATACATDIAEPLPTKNPKMAKDYVMGIFAYKGTESGIIGMADGVYNANIEPRDAELKSVQEAQNELSKYWKLDAPLEIEEDPSYSWEQGYSYRNINRPQTSIDVNKYALDSVKIRYKMIDP